MSPPHAAISSDSLSIEFDSPSSLTYPSDTNASSSVSVADTGKAVPIGALYIAPAVFGLPADTLAVEFAMFYLLNFHNNKCQKAPDIGNALLMYL